MPGSRPWDVVFGADSHRTVLCVSFPNERHHAASFVELAEKVGPGYKFLYAKLPENGPGERFSSYAYTGPWLDSIKQYELPVLAVMGYCVGSVYAAAIAEGISQWQQRAPELILFDPQLASMNALNHAFLREIDATSPLLSDDEIERARKIVTDAAGMGDEVIASAAKMIEIYLEIITVAFERAGLGCARGNNLMAPFESYIAWMAAATQIDVSGAWRNSTAIISSDYAELPYMESSSKGICELVGRSIPFDVTNSDLLRSDSIARVILEFLHS
jgi:hypothetical protein